MQLFENTYKRLCHYCHLTFLTHTEGLWVQRRPLTQESNGYLYHLEEPTHFRTSYGFPRSDHQYALITDATTSTPDSLGGLGAILTHVDKHGNFNVISFASRQRKGQEKNYSPFLLEAAAAVWGTDVFNEYLKGNKFILYVDHKPLEKMGHFHTKTISRLKATLLDMTL